MTDQTWKEWKRLNDINVVDDVVIDLNESLPRARDQVILQWRMANKAIRCDREFFSEDQEDLQEIDFRVEDLGAFNHCQRYHFYMLLRYNDSYVAPSRRGGTYDCKYDDSKATTIWSGFVRPRRDRSLAVSTKLSFNLEGLSMKWPTSVASALLRREYEGRLPEGISMTWLISRKSAGGLASIQNLVFTRDVFHKSYSDQIRYHMTWRSVYDPGVITYRARIFSGAVGSA